MNQLELERKIIIECGNIVNENRIQRKFTFGKKSRPYWDLPTVAVCCATSYSKGFLGESKRPNTNSYKTEIRDLLLLLGNIGEHSSITNEKYPIGQCAEPHAAEKCIKKLGCNSRDLQFSMARYVRTKEIIPYCANCLYIFPQLQ